MKQFSKRRLLGNFIVNIFSKYEIKICKIVKGMMNFIKFKYFIFDDFWRFWMAI